MNFQRFQKYEKINIEVSKVHRSGNHKKIPSRELISLSKKKKLSCSRLYSA